MRVLKIILYCKSDEVDFKLVNTYIPSAYLVLRSWVLLGLGVLFVSYLTPKHAVVASCYIVYVDIVLHATRTYDGYLMHTSLVGFAFFLETDLVHATKAHSPTRACDTTQLSVAAFLLDSAWAALSNIYILNILFCFFFHRDIYSMAFAAFVALHVITACESQTVLELLLRVPLFFTTAMLTYFSPTVIRHSAQSPPHSSMKRDDCGREAWKRHLHVMLLPLCLHVLFVHRLVLLGSAVVLLGIFTRIYFPTAFQTESMACHDLKPTTGAGTSAINLESETLETELRRAKASMRL